MENKTVDIIVNTFIDMLKKESISKISIKRLMNRTNFSRQTFYYYFHYGIQDLCKYVIESKIIIEPDIELTIDNFFTYYLSVIDRILKYKKVIRKIVEEYPLIIYKFFLFKIDKLLFRATLNNKNLYNIFNTSTIKLLLIHSLTGYLYDFIFILDDNILKNSIYNIEKSFSEIKSYLLGI